MTQDDFVEAEQNGIISFEFSARVQDEIARLRSDISRKDASLLSIKAHNVMYTHSIYIDNECLEAELAQARSDIERKDAALLVAEPHVEGNIRRAIREGGYKIHEGDTVQETVDSNCDMRQIRAAMSPQPERR